MASNTYENVEFWQVPPLSGGDTKLGEAIVYRRSTRNYHFAQQARVQPGGNNTILTGDQIYAAEWLEFEVMIPVTNAAQLSGPNDAYNLQTQVQTCNQLRVVKTGVTGYWRLDLVTTATEGGGMGIGNVRAAKAPTEIGGAEQSVVLALIRVLPADASVVWTRSTDAASGIAVI